MTAVKQDMANRQTDRSTDRRTGRERERERERERGGGGSLQNKQMDIQ